MGRKPSLNRNVNLRPDLRLNPGLKSRGWPEELHQNQCLNRRLYRLNLRLRLNWNPKGNRKESR
jgi:hypothetical protein